MLLLYLEVGAPKLRAIVTEATASAVRVLFPAVLLLCLASFGCGYSCYSGYWNGNGSGAAASATSCPFTKATGSVIAQISTEGGLSGASASGALPLALPRLSQEDVQHIFVTLRGIEAHPSLTAEDDSSGWQELVPELATHPLQLDLLAPLPPSFSAPSSGESPLLDSLALANNPATIPADEYRQIRLRFAALHPSSDDITPESNACGNVGWNCVVFSDRSVRPLEFTSSEFSSTELDPAAEFHVAPEPGAEIVFRLLPYEVLHLFIAFDPASSVLFRSNGAVRLVPAFRVITGALSSAT